MSKTLWHTIQIKVPAEMVELTKSGKISIKKTLTKTFNISRSQKMQAIKLIPANVNHPSIINEGKEWDVNELKLRMAKAKALQMKNKEKDIYKQKKDSYALQNFEYAVKKRAREFVDKKDIKAYNFFNKMHSIEYMSRINTQTQKGREEYERLADEKQLLHNYYSEEEHIFNHIVKPNGLVKIIPYEIAERIVDLWNKIGNLMGYKNKTVRIDQKRNFLRYYDGFYKIHPKFEN